jgi:hypothetical protein
MQARAREALREARQVTQSRPGYGPGWLLMAEAAAQCGDDEAFDTACARFAAGAEAATAQVALRATRLRLAGDQHSALQAVAMGPVTHPALAPMYAVLLFETGVRGDHLEAALRQTLTYDAFCAEAWAIKRSLSSSFQTSPLDRDLVQLRDGMRGDL